MNARFPTAQQPSRTPRSRRDDAYPRAYPMPFKQPGIGIVTAIDTDDATVTVEVLDELLPGVIPLGDMPPVDSIVEIEVRGDLMVALDWTKPTPVPVDLLTFRGETHWDVFGFDGPGAKPLALPAAAQVGDLLVLSLSPNYWAMNDGRFTSHGHGSYIGRATDLSAVDLVRVTSGGGQQWAQAVLLAFAEGDAVVAGVSYDVTTDGVTLTLPRVYGVKAAVACSQATTGTVHGWIVPNSPWLGGAYASSSAGYAGASYWSDPDATATPATACTISGSGVAGGVTVIGLR